MKTIGIIVLSWGLGSEITKRCRLGLRTKSDPCNYRLAQEAERIWDEFVVCENADVLVVAQDEVRRHMVVSPTHTVSAHRKKGEYLGSEEVIAQAAKFFRAAGVTEVIVIANPFLHLAKCKMLARKEGLTVIDLKIGYIGFNRHDQQFLPRSPIHTLLYGIGQLLFGLHGKPF